jgi:hypothetical protein
MALPNLPEADPFLMAANFMDTKGNLEQILSAKA